MPYEFPDRLTIHADEDSRRLWECLWRLIEALNLRDEAVSAELARLEEKWNIQDSK